MHTVVIRLKCGNSEDEIILDSAKIRYFLERTMDIGKKSLRQWLPIVLLAEDCRRAAWLFLTTRTRRQRIPQIMALSAEAALMWTSDVSP